MLATLFATVLVAIAAGLQPDTILTIDANPSRKIFGSLSMPGGTPWCNGMPTFWMVGHQAQNETPWCLQPPGGTQTAASFNGIDFADATFVQPKTVVLDVNDALNEAKGLLTLDRHDCVALDMNQDGLLDIVCTVGARSGKGLGYNEVYLTNVNHSVTKIVDGRGLHKYPSMRNRLVVTFKEMTSNATLLFIATQGTPRTDKLTNVHRMFRLTPNASSISSIDSFFFDEVPGPSKLWKQNSIASGLVAADINNDGFDDLIICNELQKTPLIYIQSQSSQWKALPTAGTTNWRNARVGDVTMDGIPDIIVVGQGKKSWIKIFQGTRSFPHFNFTVPPYYMQALPFAAPDVELLDVNNDGVTDIYIVQVNETQGSHCAGTYPQPYPGYSPPADYTPLLDRAPDLLLIGTMPSPNQVAFNTIFMEHAEPGCGFYLERFGNNRTMILGQGSNGNAGHTLLLQWTK